MKDNLAVFIEAAMRRREPLDHVLLYGPPGLGKTTLAHIIAQELGVRLYPTSGPALERAGDMAAVLTNLEAHEILFVDEIHRLPRVVEEILYPAMEDFCLDIIIGKGPGAQVAAHRPAALHPDRGHHQGRPGQPAAEGPLRHHRPAGFLSQGGPSCHRQTGRPSCWG